MRYFLLALLVLSLLNPALHAQDCSKVNSKKGKYENTVIYSGLTRSNESYSVLLKKELDRSAGRETATYHLFFNVASREVFTDIKLQQRDSIQFILEDRSTVTFGDVKPSNNPMGFCCSLGFDVDLTEEQWGRVAGTTITEIVLY